MAKLKVDEIETTSTNQNLEVKHGGSTGALQIKGDTNDGTLQLNCHAQTHGVKLKAPGTSQEWTAVLPDNQIAASKLLRVKSVTGSEGQLEFGDVPTAASILQNLDATGFTSGTVPANRMPAMPATGGLGLKLVSKAVVPSNGSVATVDFDLDSDSAYHFVGKNISYSTNNNASNFQGISNPQIQFLDSSGNALSIGIDQWYGNYHNFVNGNFSTTINLYYWNSSQYNKHHALKGEIVTGNGTTYSGSQQSKSWIQLRGESPGYYNGSIQVQAGFSDATVPAKIRFKAKSPAEDYNQQTYNGTMYFRKDSEFLLYKFNEATS